MMRLAVTSTSFSKSEILKTELCDALAPFGWQVKLCDPEVRWDFSSLSGFCRGCHGWLVGRESVDAAILEQIPELQFVAKYGVGFDNVDTKELDARKMPLLTCAGVNAPYVAEFALGLIISLARNIHVASSLLALGTWQKNGGSSLKGRRVGIVGFGHVGQALGELLKPFGCEVLIADIIDFSNTERLLGFEQTSLSNLLEKSDVVSLHVPLTDDTNGMIGVSELASMKRGSLLVNTSRGEVVDEKALYAALLSGHIAAAASDVFTVEPYDGPLLGLPNFLPTPHIAGNSIQSVLAMGRGTIQMILAHFQA